MINIDIDTARRFILGKQGLWPGRRQRGPSGVAQAMGDMEYLQLDPLQIIARSQDIALHSRVLDYTPGLWEAATYDRREFFDWGGWLAARPMTELPHWRVIMRRERDHSDGVGAIAREHPEAVAEMRLILRERGLVSNRDFKMTDRARTQSYRGRKDSALALYYLWRVGEAMTHHREKFERVYAPTEAVAPPHLIRESDDEAAGRFLALKEVAFNGLSRFRRNSITTYSTEPAHTAKQRWEGLLAGGDLVQVRVEGWKTPHYALGSDAAALAELSAGRVPEGWRPLGPTTTEEVVFLAPLDPVSARGRAKQLFGFDYTWEVYKPVDQRRFGYYALPVLWGDRLVARFDSKLDRATNTFVVLGFWLEDESLAVDEAFAEALARGFGRLAAFLGTDRIDVAAIESSLLRGRINHRDG